MPNHLANESSPYLLQHAHNPVDWYPWGEEALKRAAEEDKPILVSIGYAACHWCHVMERESFEDPATAAIMNEHFINIKIDREERPDLDHIYMDAVQAISGSGGWPLNVFLTPDRKPFYGGTYFPPKAMFNRSSWTDTLRGVAEAFRDRRHQIDAQAENLLSHIEASNQFGLSAPGGGAFRPENMADMVQNLLKTADTVRGGFGKAPKFPQTFSIRVLLHHYFYTGNEAARGQALLSLDRMVNGGINDQLGGGFARYSTDDDWLVPHFEKMLYDNALIVTALSEASQLTGEDRYRRAIDNTLTFVERELMSAEGGFYAALDADSEGVEGKFYTWSRAEVEAVLGGDAEAFCDYYNITAPGNWEHTNILHVTRSVAEVAAAHQLTTERLEDILRISRERLLLKRAERVRPATDDKILLGWNALMNSAYSHAFAATGNEKYRTLAVRNMSFLMERLTVGQEGEMLHAYKNGQARFPAFLDDYACLIQALIHLQEITGDVTYLEKVKTLVKWVIAHFSDTETNYFYYTNDAQQDVIVRKKELYDGAVPSGNGLMAWIFLYCGVVFDVAEWRERAFNMCSGLREVVQKYPGSFGVWAVVDQALAYGFPEIAVTGGGPDGILKEILRIFIPFKVLQSSPSEAKGFPLLAGKSFSSVPMIYVCKDYACQTPVNELPAFQRLLDGMFKKAASGS